MQARGSILFMTPRPIPGSKWLSVVPAVCALLLCAAPSTAIAAAPTSAAVAAFNSYVAGVETRLARQHQSQDGFLPLPGSASQIELRLRRGDSIIERLTPSTSAELPGALLHHWRGTAFVAGARAADFERVMRDFNGYPHYFRRNLCRRECSRNKAIECRRRCARQHHVIAVVMDATCDIAFGRLDARHGYSISRSTKVAEIDAAGTVEERTLNADQEHGFLWRLNTYWSYEERDGGLYLEIESVSLTRSIPRGLGWAVEPFLESVPRESLEFTLRSACNAMRK
jgi:hypothetical protein